MEPNPTKPFDWKAKILDNLISQKVLFGISFALMVVFVDLSPTQADTFKVLIGATFVGSAAKSIAGGLKR